MQSVKYFVCVYVKKKIRKTKKNPNSKAKK